MSETNRQESLRQRASVGFVDWLVYHTQQHEISPHELAAKTEIEVRKVNRILIGEIFPDPKEARSLVAAVERVNSND